MKRTTKPPSQRTKRMINYYDQDKKQRWGKLEEEKGETIIVSDYFGKRIKVHKSKIIEEREVPEAP